LQKIKQAVQLLQNMGIRYVLFRVWFEVQRKTGLLKKKFPTNPPIQKFITLDDWRKLNVPYFFQSKEELSFAKNPTEKLKADFNKIENSEIQFFNSQWINLGKNYDWVTNPDSKYQYDKNKHWTEIADFTTTQGDIKYVWEKSRFNFLNTVIRHDYHFEANHAQFVFNEIENWIDNNPINCGPNYRCSQEISLRVLNWTFALHYYKNAEELTNEIFEKIINSIYWQLQHVYRNINFSRIAVRNNHAITEMAMLYLSGLLFPFIPETKNWKNKGKQWFEEEVKYQIYEDGTHLQYSTNYHRVVLQLLTVTFYLAEKNNEQFSDEVYSRAKKSLQFLFQLQNESDGWLPNYGSNDGALFFNLNDAHYRDYRGQLNALYYFFNKENLFADASSIEDANWFSNHKLQIADCKLQIAKMKMGVFKNGGYATFRDTDSFTFIKCSSYKDRPAQADNLHIDIFYQGENILRDNGSYKYNSSPEDMKYFMGTASHNTIMLGDNDQMKKGGRFIWYYWNRESKFISTENETEFIFEGKIKAFEHLQKDIFHNRKITKTKAQPHWKVEDEIQHKTGLPMNQIWHPNDFFFANFEIKAVDENGNIIQPTIKEVYHSCHYGIKEKTKCIIFSTSTKKIFTQIFLKQN
jgi:hypothetical protein